MFIVYEIWPYSFLNHVAFGVKTVTFAHFGMWDVLRFIDNKDMDVVAVYNVDTKTLTPRSASIYNCTYGTSQCVLPLFDPAHRYKERSKVFVPWEVGTQNFELRCLPKGNLKMDALRSTVAWPLLMALVILFCAIIVYLMLKRMTAIEKDVFEMETMNDKLTAATMAAEAADKAKSSFLATVSHEIRYIPAFSFLFFS